MVIKKKSAAAETAGAGNYITVYAEENFKGNSERFEVRSNSIFPFLSNFYFLLLMLFSNHKHFDGISQK